jgi:hypothetical protein
VTSRNENGLKTLGRKRIYANAAERQRACRRRALLANSQNSPPVPPPKTPKKLSRPKRLAALEEGVRCLLAEYEEWRGQLPESLEGTSQAEALDSAIEALAEAADLLAGIDAPRGFGRD